MQPGSLWAALEALPGPSSIRFGERGISIIADLPDDHTEAAGTLAGNVSGTFNIHGVPRRTAEQLDEVEVQALDFLPLVPSEHMGLRLTLRWSWKHPLKVKD